MSENELMKIFAENFKRLRLSKKLYQKDIAEKLEVSSSIVSDWESGSKMPRAGAIQKIAELFGVPKSELFVEKGHTYLTVGELIRIPIVGRVSCGNGSLAFEEVESYEATPKEWLGSGEHFYLRAKGDSMINARIQEGDLLLIRKQPDVEHGEIAAVLIDDEAVLKRVYKQGDSIILQSENPKYEPIVYERGENYNFKIIGKLKMINIKF